MNPLAQKLVDTLLEGKKAKTSRLSPIRISRKPSTNEWRVAPKGKGFENEAYYTDDPKDARDTAAYMIRSRRKRSKR